MHSHLFNLGRIPSDSLRSHFPFLIITPTVASAGIGTLFISLLLNLPNLLPQCNLSTCSVEQLLKENKPGHLKITRRDEFDHVKPPLNEIIDDCLEVMSESTLKKFEGDYEG